MHQADGLEKTRQTTQPIPAHAGIGLRSPHMHHVLETRPAVAWFEVHSENFFCGGEMPRLLERIRHEYPISLHGVGLSLGSADKLHQEHLQRLGHLVDRIEPGFVSEHISWGAIGDIHLNELLPLPYTEEALRLMVERVGMVQEYLQRPILLENLSSYLEFSHSTIPEWEFVAELAARSGCRLLLDVNNVYVNSVNHGFDPRHYIHSIPADAVDELHLAGHLRKTGLGAPLLIDTHDRCVCPEVWQLFAETVEQMGPTPTLIEWDQDIPSFEVLMSEADMAEEILYERYAANAIAC